MSWWRNTIFHSCYNSLASLKMTQQLRHKVNVVQVTWGSTSFKCVSLHMQMNKHLCHLLRIFIILLLSIMVSIVICSISITPPKKLGHDCKSRAEYWQQRGCSTASDCKKLNASLPLGKQPSQTDCFISLVLVQVRIYYAEAHLYKSPAAFTATQTHSTCSNIYNNHIQEMIARYDMNSDESWFVVLIFLQA